MNVFDRIKETAKTRGWSVQTTAEKAGIGINTIYGWKKYSPAADKLRAVADTLGVSVDYLLGKSASDDANKEIDLDAAMHDDTTIMSWQGRPIPPEELEMIRRILDGGK